MKLSMPIVLQNLITFSLGLIDTFMVSQLGNTEMAAVTAANVPVFLLISIVFGVQRAWRWPQCWRRCCFYGRCR